MKKKLLNKTLRVYILYSILILAVTAPMFYFFTERLYIEDADEALILRKNEFIKYSSPVMKTSDIAVWNKVNRDIKIEEATVPLKKDSIFYKFYLDTLPNENEPYRVLLTPVSIDGKVYQLNAKLNLVESEDLIKNIGTLFLIVVSLLLIGLYFITKRLSNQLWKPFYTTLEQIERFDVDKRAEVKMLETDVEEFYRLNEAINTLIQRNTIIYKSQREFIENASHELQTPLAVFQVKLDTLMQHPSLSPDQADIILKLAESVARLNKLNRNLLLLSKIDNSDYSEKENVSLKTVIERQHEFFEEQADEKNISININAKEDVKLYTNVSLVETLVSNLLINAIRHNIENGTLNVVLNNNTLTISNTGSSNKIASERLFQRFSKTDHSVKGSGLGLAIVKKIADLNGWEINYTFSDNFHTFSVKF